MDPKLSSLVQGRGGPCQAVDGCHHAHQSDDTDVTFAGFRCPVTAQSGRCIICTPPLPNLAKSATYRRSRCSSAVPVPAPSTRDSAPAETSSRARWPCARAACEARATLPRTCPPVVGRHQHFLSSSHAHRVSPGCSLPWPRTEEEAEETAAAPSLQLLPRELLASPQDPRPSSWADLPVQCAQEHVDGGPWLSEVWTSWRHGRGHSWASVGLLLIRKAGSTALLPPSSPEVSRERGQATATLAVRAAPLHEAIAHAGPVWPPRSFGVDKGTALREAREGLCPLPSPPPCCSTPLPPADFPSGPLLTPSSGMACDWSTASVSAPPVAISTLASDNRSQAPPRHPLQTLPPLPTFKHLMLPRLG